MNLREFHDRLDEIRNGPSDQIFKSMIDFLKSEWTLFDAETQRLAMSMLGEIIAIGAKNARAAIGTLEGSERRQTDRLLAQTEGRHFVAPDAVALLETPTQHSDAVVARAREVFLPALQAVGDFLFDVRQGEFQGGRAAVLYGLLVGLIDELLVAFHLAQRSFAHQTYSHLRTVEETLDIIDLVNADETWLNRWLEAATDIQTEIDLYRETRKEVKKRGGRGKGDHDKLYAFLSATGSHPQFRGLMGRARFDKGTAAFAMFGTGDRTTPNVLVARAAVALAIKVSEVFSDRLAPEDLTPRVEGLQRTLAALIGEHLLPMAAQIRIEASELRSLLDARVK